MNGKRIALMGHARSGKDFVGTQLGIWYGHTRKAFADPLKKVAEELFPDEFTEGKPRELFQWLGEGMRARDPEVWIKHMLRRVEVSESIGIDRFVITDLRLPNEHAALKAAGFAIVKIEASLETRIRRMEAAGDNFDPKDLEHATESHIDKLPADFVITNNDDDWGVKDQMDVIMQQLGGGINGR